MINKMLKTLIILFVAVIMFSCGSVSLIEVNGYGDDYDDLSEGQKSMVEPLVSFENLDNDKVYKINPEQLKAELAKYPKSIVRLVGLSCNSDNCKSLSYYENFAKENGYKVFFVMTTYYPFTFVMNQPHDNAVFVLDYNYYGKKQRVKCERYFENELLGLPLDTKYKDIPEDKWGNTYYYEYGKLVKIEK